MINNIKHICEIGVGHIGVCFSALYWDNPNVRFTLFEPNKEYYKEILEKAGDRKNVKIHNLAIGDFNGEITLCEQETSSYLEGIDSVIKQCAKLGGNDDFKPRDRYSVPIITFDKVDDGTIDLLRVDTEGSEWFALKYLISRPKQINIETHGIHAEYLNPYLYEIADWTKTNGYSLYQVSNTDSTYILNSELKYILPRA